MPLKKPLKMSKALHAWARELEEGGPVNRLSEPVRREANTARDVFQEAARSRLIKRNYAPLMAGKKSAEEFMPKYLRDMAPKAARVGKAFVDDASNKSLIMEFMSPQKITDAAMGMGRGGRGKRKA